MLDTLRSIVQDVNSAPTFRHALDVIVARVREAMGTEVCSIYLVDPARDRFLFVATEGLNKDADRPPVPRTRSGSGRARRHTRRTDQPRRRDAPPELPLSARDRRRTVPLVPRRADHPAAARARRAGRAAARTAPFRRKRRSVPRHAVGAARRCRRARGSHRRLRAPRRRSVGTAGFALHRCAGRARHLLSAPRWSSIRPRSSKAFRIARPKTSPSN